RYPDMGVVALKQKLSARLGVATERIATGCGSVALLEHLVKAACSEGDEIVYSWRSFEAYPIVAATAGATSVRMPNRTDHGHDLPAMAAAVGPRTRVVLVCNPNNPTGTALPLERVQALLERVPSHVCVILDEAYVEFSLTVGDPFASLPLLRRHPNLVLLRTFSKVYGLAALRVGYALCGSESFRVAVDQVRQPFYLTGAAQAAAVEALKYQDEVERRVVATVAARTAVTEALRARGYWVADSDANFVWVRLAEDGEDGPLVDALGERGVVVRAGTALGGPGCARVTLGTPAENERLLAALAEL
ncbi:MAG: aminotransferase class I/II-fold pyridoxal phosphate-dependent enzyme, partial [Acidobacteriota bacterium]|nr:aminotransferase class I/II-fold pyridoxal phosphate-dependent enzyme [Acidobacteriota bacterium]